MGFWCPVLNLGGAEDWQYSLAKSVDPNKVELVGVAVTHGYNQTHTQMRTQFEAMMPVVYGTDGARIIAERCDLILQWAICGCDKIVEGLPDPPRVIAVSHSPDESPWAHAVYEDTDGIDTFVAVSELAIPPIPAKFRHDVPVIWNALDGDRLTPKRSREEMHASWGVPPGSRVIGYIGRLEDDKDPHALARAIVHLPADYHAVIVGTGWDQIELDKDAAKFPDRIHLVGGDRDAGSVIHAFDTQIVPSAYESFGLSLCEGLWCGVPVISTRVGICKLIPGLTREIHAKPTGEQLALAVLQDRLDPVGTAARVAYAQGVAKERLTLERFGREWTDYLLSQKPASPWAADLDTVREARECPFLTTDGTRRKATCMVGRGDNGVIGLRDCLGCDSNPVKQLKNASKSVNIT